MADATPWVTILRKRKREEKPVFDSACPPYPWSSYATEKEKQQALDAHRRSVSIQTRKNTYCKQKEYTEQDRKQLLALFPWALRKHAEYRSPDKVEPAKRKQTKTWRWQRPNPETEWAWRHVQQNSAAWTEIRSQSSGASSTADYMGWTHYRGNIEKWQEDMGLVAEQERKAKDCFACDLGHRDEPICRQIAQVLTGADIQETGVFIHPTMPFVTASPDGLVTYPDNGIVLNRYTVGDSLRGNFENKLTIFFALLNNLGTEKWGFPHAIRPYHVVQMQHQGICVSPDTQWCEYCSAWFYNEQAGPKPDGSRLKVGEVLLSRVYMDKEFQKEVLRYIVAHKDAVQRKKEPKRLHDACPPQKIKWIPMVQCRWFWTGYPGNVTAQSCYDPTELLHPLPDNKPSDWIGEYPPKQVVEPRVFYDQVPLIMDLQELATLLTGSLF